MTYRARALLFSAIGLLAISGLALGSLLSQPSARMAAGPYPAHSTLSSAPSLDSFFRLLGSDTSMGAPAPAVGQSEARRLQAPDAVKKHKTSHCSKTSINYGWMHTNGNWIVDGYGCHVRLESVTWYGMQTKAYVPAGLDFQPYMRILATIKALGFNSIRLPISEQMVRDNLKLKPLPKYLTNPVNKKAFKNLHPLEILDKIVAGAKAVGLYIILDNHGSLASSVKGGSHIEALWTTYTENGWIRDWVKVATRYAGNPTVVGFDLRNEPHTNGPGPWSLKTYLKQGATWGKFPNKLWNPSSNWQQAATKCGNAILKVNPHGLIFVEGVQLYPDPTQKRKVEVYWWGSILRGVATDPVVLNVRHHLVYSPHEWGPWKNNPIGSFVFNKKTTYQVLSAIFDKNWGYILSDKNVEAPIWLGEFNTCNNTALCVSDPKRGTQGSWFQILIRYLQLHPMVGWSYFPINGTNSSNERSNNSVLNGSWTKPRLPNLMPTLRKVMGQPGN
jgi:endoglucanase